MIAAAAAAQNRVTLRCSTTRSRFQTGITNENRRRKPTHRITQVASPKSILTTFHSYVCMLQHCKIKKKILIPHVVLIDSPRRGGRARRCAGKVHYIRNRRIVELMTSIRPLLKIRFFPFERVFLLFPHTFLCYRK